MINILLADDHRLVLDGLLAMLASEADIHCVGTAANGREALALLAEHPADVVLLDINMPDMDGMEACQRIAQAYPGVKLLVLSMLREASVIKLMLRHGAHGYLLKNAGKAEVLAAIRTVHGGQRYFSAEVSEVVMASLAGDGARSPGMPFAQLTKREKQVLQLIVAEYTTTEIAEKLNITFGTVETHRRNLLTKLGARNTAGLVRISMTYDLLDT
jgi:DNA-binding NarL/FixJ family response regulator